jgi:hypothetical protein
MRPIPSGGQTDFSLWHFGPAIPGAVATGFFVWSLRSSSASRAYVAFLIGSGFIGLAAGMAWWISLSRVKPCPWRVPSWVQRFLPIATAVAMATTIIWCGRRQFGGFDHSIAVDAGWRLLIGQKPYVDYPSTLPPGFYLGAYAAFVLFGPVWESLVWLHAIFSVAMFCWSYWLLAELEFPKHEALTLSACCLTMALVVGSYWWYNSITAASAITYFLSSVVFLAHPKRRSAAATYAVALWLLALMKPNVAAILITGCTFVLLSSAAHRRLTLWLSLLAASAWAALLLAVGVSPVGVVSSYHGIAGRGLSTRLFQDLGVRESLFVVLNLRLVLIPLGSPEAWKALVTQRRQQLVSLTAIAAGLVGFFTDGEVRIVESALLVTSAWIFASPGALAPPARRRNRWEAYTRAVTLGLATIGLAEAVVRHRVKGIGPGTFFEYSIPDDPVHSGFFRNTRISERLMRTTAQISDVLDSAAALNNKPVRDLNVYFGPRLQWAYAANRVRSPLGQPIWWHPSVGFPAVDETKYVRLLAQHRFDVAIFLKGDTTYFSPSAFLAVTHDFPLDTRFSELWIFAPSTPGGMSAEAK